MPDFEDDEQSPLPWLGKPEMPADDDSDMRPSIGDRMAGNVPKPAPAPVDTPAPAMPQVQVDPSKLPSGIIAPPTPDQVPKPPTGSNNPNLVDLARQQAQYGKPLDPNAVDPATGKSKYKMGVGGKILGSLANFASGFGRNPGQPIYVGPGATNARYSRDEAMREGNLANVNTQIGTQEKLDTTNQKMYEDAIKQAYDTQLGGAREKLGAAAETNAATRAQLEQSQRDLNEARANKADTPKEPSNEIELAQALQTAKMKGDKQGVAKYQGALDTLRQLKAAGKDTSASDVAKALGVAKFRSDEHDKINKEQDSEREKRYSELDKDATVKYSPAKMAAAKAKIDSDLEAKYAPRHQKADTDADQMFSLTKSGKALQSGNTPPSPNRPKTPPKVGETILVAGKPRKVVGFNPNTKKPIVAPEGQ